MDPTPRARGGIDTDAGIAGTVHQAVQRAGQDAARAVGGVIRLQAHRHRAGQPDRVAEARHHPGLAGDQDQILIAHQLAHRRNHFRGQPGGDSLQALRSTRRHDLLEQIKKTGYSEQIRDNANRAVDAIRRGVVAIGN